MMRHHMTTQQPQPSFLASGPFRLLTHPNANNLPDQPAFPHICRNSLSALSRVFARTRPNDNTSSISRNDIFASKLLFPLIPLWLWLYIVTLISAFQIDSARNPFHDVFSPRLRRLGHNSSKLDDVQLQHGRNDTGQFIRLCGGPNRRNNRLEYPRLDRKCHC